MRPPKVKVGRVNLKPLLPPGSLETFDAQKVLRSISREVVKQLRDKILQEPFSDRAKVALSKAIGVTVGPRSITITAKHPAFKPLLEGRKARQMTWLTKAKRPIPIITEDGELIFRSATPRSMQRGSWYHPGRSPTTVIERARKEARKSVKKRIVKALASHVRKTYKKGSR
jgi:hypothetical protein